MLHYYLWKHLVVYEEHPLFFPSQATFAMFKLAL